MSPQVTLIYETRVYVRVDTDGACVTDVHVDDELIADPIAVEDANGLKLEPESELRTAAAKVADSSDWPRWVFGS